VNGGFHFIIFKKGMSSSFFEIAIKTTSKIHDLILKFNNTKFYFILLVVYEIK
jgi:hypothetical protein